MDNFGQTRMGQEFYEGTMKSINKNLDRIATALETLVKQGERNADNISFIKGSIEDIRTEIPYLR